MARNPFNISYVTCVRKDVFVFTKETFSSVFFLESAVIRSSAYTTFVKRHFVRRVPAHTNISRRFDTNVTKIFLFTAIVVLQSRFAILCGD